MPLRVWFQINRGTFSTVCSSPKSDSGFLWYSNLVICTTEIDRSFINITDQRAVYNRVKPVLQAHGSCTSNASWINIYVSGSGNEWMKYVCAFQPSDAPANCCAVDWEGLLVQMMWAESLSELRGQGGTKWLFHFRFGIKRKRRRHEVCPAWVSVRRLKLDFVTGS